MNGEGPLGNILLIAVIILFMVGSIFLRRRSAEKTELGKIISLLSEINQNLKIIDAFSFHWRAKKLKTGAWQRNEAKLDFIGEKLQTTLANAFGMAEEFNRGIDEAKRHKSTSYLASIQVDKLKDTMTKGQQELGEWFQENKDKQELLPRKRGLFG